MGEFHRTYFVLAAIDAKDLVVILVKKMIFSFLSPRTIIAEGRSITMPHGSRHYFSADHST